MSLLAPKTIDKTRPTQTFLGRVYKEAKRRKIDCDISLNDLNRQFDMQLGRCIYSGHTLDFEVLRKTASLDRVSSNGGYSIDNIQFVHKTVNIMKHAMSESRFLFLVNQIRYPLMHGNGDYLNPPARSGQFRGTGWISGEALGQVSQRARDKNFDFNLDADYINTLFIKQQGRCALTNLALFPKEYRGGTVGDLSVDRIDNHEGYIKGNIQLVIKDANFLRGSLTLEELYAWCDRIVEWTTFTSSLEFLVEYNKYLEGIGI